MNEAWVLYFFIVFINGDSFMLENNQRFETRGECLIEGMQKGSSIVENIILMSGIPASGQFTCNRVGVDT